jgi:hypothetical protein
MKRFKALAILLIISLQLSFAFEGKSVTLFQSDENERFVYGGIGIVIGIFSPADINEYMEDQTSHLLITSGTVSMFSNYGVKPSVTVRPHRIIEIGVFGEFSWAPKFILVSGDESYYFSFTRVSPGITPKIHLPFGTGRHSLFFAPAVTYNFLTFKDSQDNQDFKGNSVGGKMQVGFCLDFRKMLLEPFIAYDYAKATDMESGYSDFELNYSSFQLGVEILF